MDIQKRGEEMDKKIGRPTDSPKVEQYRLRMSAEEVVMLEYCCRKTGKSKADIFREGLKSVYERLKEQ
mgnify:FL=1